MKKLCYFAIILYFSSCSAESEKLHDKASNNFSGESGDTTSILSQDKTPVATSEKSDNDTFFYRTPVLGGKVSISLPKTFHKMSPDMIERKYPPGASRPSEVYTNESSGINIGFRHTTTPGSQQTLKGLQRSLLSQFKAMDVEGLKSEIVSLSGKDYILNEFISTAIDSKIYNLIFVTDVDGRIMVGTFNCVVKYQAEWQAKAHEMISSLVVK